MFWAHGFLIWMMELCREFFSPIYEIPKQQSNLGALMYRWLVQAGIGGLEVCLGFRV